VALIIAGTLTIDPAKGDAFREAAAAVMEGTRAEAGNHAYVLAIDPLDPATVNVYEKWESEEALAAHMAEPHFQAFGAAMGGFGIAGVSMLKYQIASEGPLF
jgi:quinol monooxygenase YgiN